MTQECLGKAGDVLDDVFFVLKGRVEGHLPKPGKKVADRDRACCSDSAFVSVCLGENCAATFKEGSDEAMEELLALLSQPGPVTI